MLIDFHLRRSLPRFRYRAAVVYFDFSLTAANDPHWHIEALGGVSWIGPWSRHAHWKWFLFVTGGDGRRGPIKARIGGQAQKKNAEPFFKHNTLMKSTRIMFEAKGPYPPSLGTSRKYPEH